MSGKVLLFVATAIELPIAFLSNATTTVTAVADAEGVLHLSHLMSLLWKHRHCGTCRIGVSAARSRDASLLQQLLRLRLRLDDNIAVAATT